MKVHPRLKRKRIAFLGKHKLRVRFSIRPKGSKRPKRVSFLVRR